MPPRPLVVRCAPGFAALAAVLAVPAAAQPADLRLPRAEVVERVAAASDTAQAYALYVPSGYDPARPPPALLVMDPRGRALDALGRFRAAAERHGWVVLSAYGTRSDTDDAFEANGRALSALLVDAQARFRVDPRRLYLAGFSGTAHFAWAVAPQLDGHLAGVVGVGSGLLPGHPYVGAALRMRRRFAYAGVAGTTDFNHDEARAVDRALEGAAAPHRFATFDGPHAWPPEGVAAAAVDWLQLQAMRAGLAAPDTAWLDVLRDARIAEARALDEAGAGADALDLYRAVLADFGWRGGVGVAARRAEALAQDPAARRTRARRDSLSGATAAYETAVAAFAEAYRAGPPPPHDEALRRLHVEALHRTAADTTDADAAAAARRMLAAAFSITSFYEARAYLGQRDWARTAGMLRLARALVPASAAPCYPLAQAEAGLGHVDAALDALRCALDGRAATRAAADADPLLAPLRADPRYSSIRPRGEAP